MFHTVRRRVVVQANCEVPSRRFASKIRFSDKAAFVRGLPGFVALDADAESLK
jgi:hypothetical protein